MKISEAIAAADAVRPNTVDDVTKAAWLYDVEGDLSELLRLEEPPRNVYLENPDTELLMPYGHDNFYTLYLMAMIDMANEESDLYNNDMAAFNQAYLEARQWWNRNHEPKKPPTQITGWF